MTFWKLIRRSLRFHARSHLGVVLGATIGSAVLIGALVVGDSVRESLRQRALSRLGWVDTALAPGDKFFSQDLAWGFEQAQCHTAPVLSLSGIASLANSSTRANRVNILGIEEYFFFQNGLCLSEIPSNSVILNQSLAAQLNANIGNEIILRIRKPSAFSAEMPISSKRDDSVPLRLKVQSIVNSQQMGDFSVRANNQAPLNALVRLDELAAAIGLRGKANMLLAGELWIPKAYPRWRGWIERLKMRFPNVFGTSKSWQKEYEPAAVSVTFHSNHLSLAVKFADYGLSCRSVSDAQTIELRSERIFLESAIVRAGFAADSNALGVSTYLVNLLRNGTNTTPYSMVTAAGAPWTPADMRDDEIILNQWLADDLQAKSGDEISLTYFDPESGVRLAERTNIFRVRGIVPMEMPWADRTLMPDFPGIEKAESTSDWDAGFPLVHKIRPKDEDYWKKYRGTPKAFVTLAAGKKMWANRFGELTAIRFQVSTNVVETLSTSKFFSEKQVKDELESILTNVVGFRAALEKKILATLKPEELGLRFEPVREQALKAAEESQDFGQLFLGFSFFIIVAALVLMALLFQFGLEQRTTEIGTLLALGFTQKQVRRLLLREGIVLALIGGAIGALGGIFYAKAMLRGLTTVWRDAVGASSLQFYASPKTLAIGFLASTIVATLTIWLTLRKQAKRSARELLAGDLECGDLSPLFAGNLLPSNVAADAHWWERLVQQIRRAALRGAAWATSRPSGKSGDKSPHSKLGWLAIGCGLMLIGWAIARGETANAGIFFSAGALVLLAGLMFSAAWLKKLATQSASAKLSFGSFGVRNSIRRRKRTLATISMLACGSFLIVAISAFRLDSNQNATKRSSGTGGFALIGETTMPVVHDLNSKSGRDFFALNESDFGGVSFVPFRVREGDEASCLNLNRAQKPRVIGVKPEQMEARFNFVKRAGWQLLKSALRTPHSALEIPAIGDANSIQWALHKKIGDTIDYTDERGNVFKLRIVGAVANSILQGSLIIDEAEFVKRFPSESGYKMFLVDAPTNRVAEVSAALSRAMEDVGLELTPAARRLNEFNAVQNTYLGTFQILGGLGLLLGSAGLGIVVLRNVLERRGELGLLVAVGFRKRALQWMLLSEHGALLGVGLGIGVLAAAVAILPSLISPSAEIPFASVGVTLGAVLLNGAVWTWVATWFAVRGNLLAALRNE